VRSVLAAALVLATIAPRSRAAELFGWDRLIYTVEWRLVRSGTVTIEPGLSEGHVHLESAGLLSALFKVEDKYTIHYDANSCAANSTFDTVEGKHHRETVVTFDRDQHRASYVQRDLVNNSVMRSGQTDIPDCPHDLLAGLTMLRGNHLDVGQSTIIVLSDGRRTGNVKLEAQAREEITTPAGTFKTIRYEADILNGVIYARKGRAFIWATDDADRMPVEIKLRMAFPIGTVTLDLEKPQGAAEVTK
jgi:Protein of unknown function (DUF3108)